MIYRHRHYPAARIAAAALTLLILSMISRDRLAAQDTLADKPESFLSKKHLSVAAVSAVPLAILWDSYYMWWKGSNRSFSFTDHSRDENWFSQPGYYGIDKIGHAYTSYFFYSFNKNILLLGGHSRTASMVAAAAISAGIGVLIELGDSFAPYGFDYQDLTFNLAGTGYGLLQDEVPFFQGIQMKWSYFPSEGYTFPPKFTDHYDAHIYWFSFNLTRLLKQPAFDCVPFLQPAIGYSVENKGKRIEFVVGLDWNLDVLRDDRDDLVGLAMKTLRMLHFPAPGMKFSPGAPPVYRLLLLN